MRPIIYCFQSCGVCGCMCVSVCVSVSVPTHARMCPVKNVTDLVQVLLKVVLLAPWLLLMNTHFIICQWCSNHCWPSDQPVCGLLIGDRSGENYSWVKGHGMLTQCLSTGNRRHQGAPRSGGVQSVRWELCLCHVCFCALLCPPHGPASCL